MSRRKRRQQKQSSPNPSVSALSAAQNLKNPQSLPAASDESQTETQWDITRRKNKEDFLAALASDECRGVIYVAASKSGVGLTTVYDYMKQDKDFADQVRSTRIAVGGAFVESKLFERIAGVTVAAKGKKSSDEDEDGPPVYTIPPSVTAIRTYLLSEMGAEMGYKAVSKQEIEGGANFAILEVPDNGRSVKQPVETDGD